MDLIKAWRLSPSVSAIPSPFCAAPICVRTFSFQFSTSPYTRPKPLVPIPRGKSRDSDSEPLLESSIVQEVSFDDDDEEEFLDEFEYGTTALNLLIFIVSLCLFVDSVEFLDSLRR